MDNRNYWVSALSVVIIFCAVLILGYSFWVGYSERRSDRVEDGVASDITLSIQYDSGNSVNYREIDVSSGSTIYDLLSKVLAENNIPFQYKDYGGDMGIFIENINGVGGGADGSWWQYWINEKYGETSISTQRVVSGDVVEFKYTNQVEE